MVSAGAPCRSVGTQSCAVTLTRMRLDGYVRVSQVRGRGGDTFISPAVQRERINAWIGAYGHERLEVFEELDESGARSDRPLLLEAIERVERGESDGIVVAKLDRFGRSLVDGLQLIERIRAAGGTFVSVADGFDLTTDTGRLVLRIMLSLAEFELDRVRGNWRDAKTRAVMRGIHPSATPPFGYRREGRGGPLLVDPVTGPLVTELYRRRAAGEGWTALGRWLASEGASTQWGRENWSLRAVRDIVRNRVYLGVAYAGDVENPDAHPALTNELTWRAAQRRGQQATPRGDGTSIISPLVRCAGCRYIVRVAWEKRAGDRRVLVLSCRSRSAASWDCSHPAYVAGDRDEIERWVVDRFLAELPRMEAETRAVEAGGSLTALEREVDTAQGRFERWRDDPTIEERVGYDDYMAGLQSRQQTLNDALAAVARERARHRTLALPVAAADIRSVWPELTRDQQRDLLRAGVQAVFLRRASRGTSLDERLHVVWPGEDVDLPARGYRDFVARPFAFPDGHAYLGG